MKRLILLIFLIIILSGCIKNIKILPKMNYNNYKNKETITIVKIG